MAGEWRDTTLGEVTEFLSGGTPSKDRPDYWVGSVPWVSAKDMKRFRLNNSEDHVSEEAVANGTKLVPAETVLLLARGMTLLNDIPICVITRPMTFNQDVKALRPKPHVRNDYLPYLLLGNKNRLLSLVDLAGHGTGRLNSDELKALDVTLPPIDEQRAIAHILGTLDDKIELNRRMNETLEAMARALFKSWFVDFLPVRAKMAAKDNDPSFTLPKAEPGQWFVYAIECEDGSLYIGQTEDLRQRWQEHLAGRAAQWTKQHRPVAVVHRETLPSREEAVEREKWLKTGFGRKWLKKQTTAIARTQTGDPIRAKAEDHDPGLPKPLADLFPDSFEDSELGEIPKGWGVGTLENFAVLNPESWSKQTRPAVIHYVDLSNTKWGRVETVTTYPRSDAPSRAQRVLRPGDAIVGTVRPGNGSYAFVSENGLTGSTGFAVLRPQETKYEEFVYLAATSGENIEALSHLADGGAYPAVRPEVVISTPVIRPDMQVLGRFSQATDPLLAKMAQNERESLALAALRDTLLPKLISGELRVEDAERGVEIV